LPKHSSQRECNVSRDFRRVEHGYTGQRAGEFTIYSGVVMGKGPTLKFK